MEQDILSDLKSAKDSNMGIYSSDEDTYIRKNTYLILGRLYRDNLELRDIIIKCGEELYENGNENQKQTIIYLWGEIGKINLNLVSKYLEGALNENSSKVKNAVMGSLKQIGEKNPDQALEFSQKFLNHPDPEVRRVIIHGIELRGRTHPEDVLPLLHQVQYEQVPRVRNMIIHVIGQISYKKDCLEKVVSSLVNWENEELVKDALKEIIEVHKRYKFSSKSVKEADSHIKSKFGFNFFLVS
ncbi:HEAT repeat domain-containing protein [Methanobacterium alcaliphilum]|nr:HEAT repeat domain-containing protein [Methanobacterium alcaliphilum]MCK9152609.1 HEAT repeat domain-containing protein [Methanobacterium alcaliphilum]